MMKKHIFYLLISTALAVSFVACGWKPEVAAVPITGPWSTMSLPIKENAVIWASTPIQFKAVHKEDKKTILGKYTEALKSQGWTLEKFDDKSSANIIFVDLSKGSEKLQLQIYDFQGTGVIIDKS